jgi:trehalose-6-phosphate hydrolase
MSSTTIEHGVKYSRPDRKELNMIFSFHHMKVDYPDGEKWVKGSFDLRKLKKVMSEWQKGMYEGGGWNALFWCNHDQPRIVSRFGNETIYRRESATMLATALHMLQGTPYIYQGEEIGMTNPHFDSIDEYRDVETLNAYRLHPDKEAIMEAIKQKSRDNSRTPMQWNSEKYAGFSTTEPWINVAPNYKEINVENALQDPRSILYHYKELIRLRKTYDIITYGKYELLLEDHPRIWAYTRSLEDEALLVVNNFSEEDAEFILPEGLPFAHWNSRVLIANYEDAPNDFRRIPLRPYESVVFHFTR